MPKGMAPSICYLWRKRLPYFGLVIEQEWEALCAYHRSDIVRTQSFFSNIAKGQYCFSSQSEIGTMGQIVILDGEIIWLNLIHLQQRGILGNGDRSLMQSKEGKKATKDGNVHQISVTRNKYLPLYHCGISAKATQLNWEYFD